MRFVDLLRGRFGCRPFISCRRLCDFHSTAKEWICFALRGRGDIYQEKSAISTETHLPRIVPALSPQQGNLNTSMGVFLEIREQQELFLTLLLQRAAAERDVWRGWRFRIIQKFPIWEKMIRQRPKRGTTFPFCRPLTLQTSA